MIGASLDFLKAADGTDTSRWLANGPGTAQRPGDIGYWVAYRIAKQYYARAKNKRQAFEALIRLVDPRAILKASGWPDSVPTREGGAQTTCKLGADYFPEQRAH